MGEAKEPKLLCYNKGCGQEFKESENRFNSCRFHPGEPFFHDAYKGWTCCRKSTDFTEFLNMKGCAQGFHSNVKPPEQEKKKPQQVKDEEVIQVSQPKYVAMERPPVDGPMVTLNTTLSESLKKQTYGQGQGDVEESAGNQELKVGVTKCVNKGCKTTYQGVQTDSEFCKYHPGVPIFHEGLKYWSCCQKRTTDFEVFMQQVGCTSGSHVWVQPKDDNETDQGGMKAMKCRHDWHQDGSFVHIVVYGGGKKFDPSKSFVKANGVKLSMELYFPEEHGQYQETWLLTGIIRPEQSTVLMTPMKVEIKLKKAEPVHWPQLNISEEVLRKVADMEREAEEHKNVGVDPVDLSDL